ncbi:MAG: beta-eliminating lyase-related protein [Micropepsaceae bacterium]
MNFASDNTAGAHPAILQAMAAAAEGPAPSYGADPWSARLTARLGEWFGHEVAVFPVATGGAANALALAQIAPPWSAVFCHRESHIHVDECGAPEFYTGGAKLVTVGVPGGKMTPDDLAAAMAEHPRGVVHRVQPGAVSITNATECGLVYDPADVAAIADVTHDAGLSLHMDGARFANALAFLNCAPADLTWRAGVDVLSLGFTKNGAVAAEAVVFFDAARAADFAYRRKRGGHLFSKSRFLASQFLAMLEGDLWRDLAGAANAAASALGAAAAGAGYPPVYPVQANEVFLGLPVALAAKLKEAGAVFYPWTPESGETGLYRFVCSYATRPEEVELLADRLKSALS